MKRIVSSDKITSYPYGYKGKKHINYIKNIYMGIFRSKIILKCKMLNLDDIVSNNKIKKDKSSSECSTL